MPLESQGSNPPKELSKVNPESLAPGDVVYVKSFVRIAVRDTTGGDVIGMRSRYYECEIGEGVVISREPMPSFPPGHRTVPMPVGTELPIGALDPGEFYWKAS